jgi:hypothetical protein
LHSRSCVIDGEAVACGENGVASFDRIRYRHHDASVFLYAFDLIEPDGDDLRRDPLAVRKATLASLLARAASGQEQEPGGTGGAARGRGGLSLMMSMQRGEFAKGHSLVVAKQIGSTSTAIPCRVSAFTRVVMI